MRIFATSLIIAGLLVTASGVRAQVVNPTPPPPSGPPYLAGPGTYAPPPSAPFFLAGPETYAPRFGQPGDLPPTTPMFGYGSYFWPFLVGPQPVTTPDPNLPEVGALRLRVRPLNADVFVDDFPAGTVADFGGPGRELEAGPHRIEIRAEGFETFAFDQRILANETTTYRYDLWPTRNAPPSTPAVDTVAVSRTYYVIPGCYAGNMPPTPALLPAGCDASQVRDRSYMVRLPARPK